MPSAASDRLAIQDAMFETPPRPRQRRRWKPRIFVTNDELRTCLSKNVLAPWLDRAADDGGLPTPSPLLAYAGPVSIAALDAAGRRGRNTYWVGLELDGSVLPDGATAPAALDAVLPFSCVKRIVFRSVAERDQFEATPFANVALRADLAVCDPTWFLTADTRQPVHAVSGNRGGAPSLNEVERIDAFRRLFGAAIALLDGANTDGTLAHTLVGLTRPRGSEHAWSDKTDLSAVSSLFGTAPACTDDAGVAAWRWAAGLGDTTPPTDPLEVLDERVRHAVIKHLRATADPVIDQRALSEAIEITAAECRRDERLGPVAERYPRAVANLRRVWRNEIGWRALLEVWPEGFPTLQAVLVMGSVSDADRFGVLQSRVRELGISKPAAQLARLLYGLRWGIEAIPVPHRGAQEHQDLLEATVWSVPQVGTTDAWRRAAFVRGRGGKAARTYALDLRVANARARLDVPLETVVRAKFGRACQTVPEALCRAILDRRVTPAYARPFMAPRRRGQQKAWADWPDFERSVMEGVGLSDGLRQPSELRALERLIDGVLSGLQEPT